MRLVEKLAFPQPLQEPGDVLRPLEGYSFYFFYFFMFLLKASLWFTIGRIQQNPGGNDMLTTAVKKRNSAHNAKINDGVITGDDMLDFFCVLNFNGARSTAVVRPETSQQQ